MTWRAPRYCYRHALRDAGESAITGLNAFHADYPKTRLIDERSSVNMKFAASDNDHYIQMDRGSASEPAITRLFIPSGHNFGATGDIRLRADTTDDMATATLLIAHDGDGENVGTGDIDITFDSNTEQYVRLDWPNQSGQWELPELWLTDTVTIIRGPEPKWTDHPVPNAVAIPKASGERPVIETGAAQRLLGFQYAHCETADTASLDALIAAVGISKPFIVDPPYDDEAAIIMKFIEAPRSTWDHPIPQLGVKSKRFELRMLQVLE